MRRGTFGDLELRGQALRFLNALPSGWSASKSSLRWYRAVKDGVPGTYPAWEKIYTSHAFHPWPPRAILGTRLSWRLLRVKGRGP